MATALGHGAGAHGFTGEVWTLRRIAQVVEREFGARYHPCYGLGGVISAAWHLPYSPLRHAGLSVS